MVSPESLTFQGLAGVGREPRGETWRRDEGQQDLVRSRPAAGTKNALSRPGAGMFVDGLI